MTIKEGRDRFFLLPVDVSKIEAVQDAILFDCLLNSMLSVPRVHRVYTA